MADIPNTEYITINKDGVFVGGKPATHYRGVKIYGINYVKNAFAGIQEQNPNIIELHVLSSKTSGEFATVDNPSSKHGSNAWCRVKNNGGKLGNWVFGYAYTSAAYCAFNCANDCAYDVLRADAAFRRALLGTALDKQNVETNSAVKPENPEIEKLKAVDLSKLAGKPVQLNGYEIVVKKIAETKQIKR